MIRREINEYLFLEFGVEGDVAQVSDHWPFQLNHVVTINGEEVFEFSADGEDFYAIYGRSLNFMPKEDFTIEDLRFQLIGAQWIGERDPVDLNTSRGEHPVVPMIPKRKERILSLAGDKLNIFDDPRILEGLFLEKTQEYLALISGPEGDNFHIVGDQFLVKDIPRSSASSWRVLSREIGRQLTEKELSG